MKRPLIYLIGSLRNSKVPLIGNLLREAKFDVFDDWYAGGPNADDCWAAYERGRGRTFVEALGGFSAAHTFMYDYHHLRNADIALLVLPAGKSAHLELGWMIGQGKPGYVLLDSPERWDVMYKFAAGVFDNIDTMVERLRREHLR